MSKEPTANHTSSPAQIVWMSRIDPSSSSLDDISLLIIKKSPSQQDWYQSKSNKHAAMIVLVRTKQTTDKNNKHKH